MSISEWLPVILSNMVFVAVVIWWLKYLKPKVAELSKTPEQKRINARIDLARPFIFGAGLIILTMISWPSIPHGNEYLAFLVIIIGVAFIFFGLLKWRKSAKKQ